MDPSLVKTKILEKAAKEVSKAKVLFLKDKRVPSSIVQ